METADHELLALWVEKGDADAFRKVALRYAGMVYGVCQRILRNSADAEDAAQETFARLAGLEKAGVNLGPWLHRVAVNCSLVHLRSERRRVRREQAFTTAAQAQDEPAPGDLLAHLDEAVAALPARLREPLVSHFYNGETHEAIAARTGMSRQAVGYRVQKAVANVRAELKKKGVVTAVGAVAAAMRHDLAEAAPAGIVTHIGKLAVLGHDARPPSAAIAAASSSKLVPAIVVAALIVGLSILAINSRWRSAADQKPAPPAPPQAQLVAAVEQQQPAHEPAPTAQTAAAPIPEIPDNETGDAALLVSVFYSNGDPAAGADVRLTRGRDIGTPNAALLVRRATTDAEGNVVFARIPAGGTLSARAVENGTPFLGMSFRGTAVWGGSYNRSQLILYPVVATEGAIVDESGAPVPGAMVYPVGIAVTPALLKELTHRAEPENVETRFPAPLEMAARADAQGRCAIDIWPGMLLQFLVIAPGFAPKRTDFTAAGQPFQLALAKGTEVRGTITVADTGDPLPAAAVKVENPREDLDRQFAQTDAQGRFIITGLGPGEYRIGLDHPDYALHPDDLTFLLATEKSMDLMYAAVGTGSVSGRVVDVDTGEGIGDVRVRCGIGSFERKTATDADGRFTIAGVCGKGYVTARPDESYSEPDEILDVEVLPGQETGGLIFKCRKRDTGLLAWLSGGTVDTEGRAVPGVYVRARDMLRNYSGGAVSDANGAFRIDRIPVTGTLLLYGETPGLASATLRDLTVDAGGLENVELVLQPTGTISGTVVDVNGKPYSAVDWEINSQFDAALLGVPVMPGGVFRFVDVPTGTHALYIQTESSLKVFFSRSHVIYSGWIEPAATIELAPGQHVSGVLIPCGHSVDKPRSERTAIQPEPEKGKQWMVRGLVLGPDGQPVTQIRYSHSNYIELPGYDEPVVGGASTTRGPGEGRWWWQGTDPFVTITFEAKGCLPLTREFRREDGAGDVRECDIRMQPGCVVEGRVLDTSGNPVAGARIHIGQVWEASPEPFLTEIVQADAEGNYRVDTLAPEPIELFAEHPSFARGSLVVSPAHSRTTRADIVVTGGGGFEGRVYSAGQPVKNARVQYGNADEPGMHTIIEADESGFYRVAHVPQGPVKTRISMPWSPGDEPMISSERPLTIEEGRVQTVDVHFPAMTARVTGTVTLHGAPAPKVHEVFRSLNAYPITVDPMEPPSDGLYDTGPVPAGEGEVTVSAHLEWQSLRRVLRVTLNDGDTLTQDVDFTGAAGITGAINGDFQVFLYEGDRLPAEDAYALPVATAVPNHGTYTLQHLSAGTYTLYAGGPPVTPENGVTELISLAEGEQKVVDLDVGGVEVKE